ncbi:MAG: NAD(P)H-dependent oxidoreductase [Planctomycetes bacterium]|nr:NAD(P)H-dependent oxidoreductase [Planctomycetota bacterium]
MSHRILVLLGHPTAASWCGDLAAAYARGAQAEGHEVRRLDLGALRFDPILRQAGQALEPDLQAAQESLRWCSHLVLVTPIWWGTVPALLKGFFDRTLLPGFAYQYRKGSPWWDRLLAGRSARLVLTGDAPTWWQRWMLGDPAERSLRLATLRFCGFAPVRSTCIGQVRSLDAAARARWGATLERLGRAAG